MPLDIRKILIITLIKNHLPVYFDEKIYIGSETYKVDQIFVNKIIEGSHQFINSDCDYLLILNPSRLKKNIDITSYVSSCVEFLANNEHYAICQPSIVYGELLDEYKKIIFQQKSHSYITSIDDAFLMLKGTVVKNFQLAPFISSFEMDWDKYREEINFYGFETFRLCTCYLEVSKDEAKQYKIPEPYDSLDLVNISYIRKTYDIGIDLSSLDSLYSGTTEYAINILKFMIEIFTSEQISFQVIVDSKLIKKFNLDVYTDYLIDPIKCEENFYKLLFVPQQVYSVVALEKINRICFKFVFTLFDVIALRCRYIGEARGFDIASSLAYKYSENVLGLTQSSSKDTEAFFNERMIQKTVIPILLTKEIPTSEMDDDFSNFSEKDYILVVGNAYKHKAIEKTLNELYNSNLKLIVLGDEYRFDKFKKRFKFYTSGQLSDQLVNLLYKNCTLILYPSLYEGFGLPVLAALQMGKKILVFDSNVNREIKEKFDKYDLIHFFSYFSELRQAIQKIRELSIKLDKHFMVLRTWKTVSEETTKILLNDLRSPLDFDKLNRRIYDIREVRKILETSHWIRLNQLKSFRKLLFEIFIRKLNWYLRTVTNFLFGLVRKD